MAFTAFTEQDFNTRFGILLAKRIPASDDQSSAAKVLINDVVEEIQEHILSNMASFDFDDVSTIQQTYINRAAMEQLKWRLDNSDFGRESGFNAFNESLVPLSEIERRRIAPRASKILNSHIISRCF